MIYLFLADGFEEIEALAPADILRRGGEKVLTVGVTGNTVRGAHGIEVSADILPCDVDLSALEAVILPGGMPGTLNLKADKNVQNILKFAFDNKKLIAAICAAPSILGEGGYLEGKRATCFPGFEDSLKGAEFVNKKVVCDGNIITGCGAGAAMEFGKEILAYMTDCENAEKILKAMLY